MKRHDLNDLAAFAVVAEHGSFTRAAAQLGMSQSALSHAMKALEARLGVRLLSRTTRSVSTTEAGEMLLRSLRPALETIASGLTAVGATRDRPSGTLRITATKHAVTAVVMPALQAWEFEEKGRPFELRVDGPLSFTNGDLILDAALAGHGIAYAYEDTVTAHVAAVRLTRVLEKWCPPFPGYYLYHPSRRQTPPALSALIAALRYRAPSKR